MQGIGKSGAGAGFPGKSRKAHGVQPGEASRHEARRSLGPVASKIDGSAEAARKG
jgi:hypothetical protein